MFGIGMTELLVIMAVALVVFGPKRLPELARSLGRALGEFRHASNDLRQTLSETPPQRAGPTPPADPARPTPAAVGAPAQPAAETPATRPGASASPEPAAGTAKTERTEPSGSTGSDPAT